MDRPGPAMRTPPPPHDAGASLTCLYTDNFSRKSKQGREVVTGVGNGAIGIRQLIGPLWRSEPVTRWTQSSSILAGRGTTAYLVSDEVSNGAGVPWKGLFSPAPATREADGGQGA